MSFFADYLRHRGCLEADDDVDVRLASADEIRSWSNGEISNPSTLNYDTGEFTPGGLYCPQVFGPITGYRCSCQRLEQAEPGGRCRICGTEALRAAISNQRMGHIELAAPLLHFWAFTMQPSLLALLLDMRQKNVRDIVAHEQYLVMEPGSSDLAPGDMIDMSEIERYQRKYPGLECETGPDALCQLLQQQDLAAEAKNLRTAIKAANTVGRVYALPRRLAALEQFEGPGNSPHHVVLRALPVLPPDFRPLFYDRENEKIIPRIAINDLYRRVFNRNNRLKKLLEMNAPAVIVRNEKRMLQQAVNALLDNGAPEQQPLMDHDKKPFLPLSAVARICNNRLRTWRGASEVCPVLAREQADIAEQRLTALRTMCFHVQPGSPSHKARNEGFTVLFPPREAPPEFSVEQMFQTAIQRDQAGQVEAALDDFSKITGHPNADAVQRANAFTHRGVIRYTLGDADGAIADYSAAIELPDAPKETIAMAYFNRGLARPAPEDAAADFRAALDCPGADDSTLTAAREQLSALGQPVE